MTLPLIQPMDVIVIDDDKTWRRYISRQLEAAGYRVHAYEGPTYTPDALLTWRLGLDVQQAAAIVDIVLDTPYDVDFRRASFDAVEAWRSASLSTAPVLFISSSEPASWEQRAAARTGGRVIDPVKQDVASWPALLTKEMI